MSHISYENVSDVSYDPYEEKYWDHASLERELNRAFDLCNGCRMCFKYCPSFPSLFRFMDHHAEKHPEHQSDVRDLTVKETNQILDECFQCKICYVKCPYTDRDHHKFNLNYPALLQRAQHVRAKEQGIPFRERILANPDLAGKMNTGLHAPLVNLSMKVSFHRMVMEWILGVDRKKLMPEFHKSSFAQWYRKERKMPLESEEKVVLFSTCFVNYNNPDLGKDVLYVLEKNNVSVHLPDQNCCGMPGLNNGDLDWAIDKMKKNVERLYPFASQGYSILAINPTCSLTLKTEMTTFLPPGEWRERAEVVAKKVMDVNEYLFELKKKEKFNRDFKSRPESIAYHAPCHLRAQNIGYRSRDMMRTIPETDISVVDECCGHDGTWAMKKEFFSLSLETGKRAFEGLNEAKANYKTTDCPLAALQIEQGSGGSRPLHPVQILAKAYRLPEEGGFKNKIS